MDGAEVCQRLRISKRTLQSYRDRRVLPYSNVGGKFFYRETDVTGFLRTRTIRKGV
ncbi:helix-turn-helix domain-containing protein [uncultured Alistipes sp.]|uniref:helix-turn-helix domain-containing protein n=1 Tax=uncultured Alistipes sp. TaxID=538949 RepID=UPI00258334AB|nr:helix-turn-helix domain-containing protein [uncultured Alistipes sp.]